MPAYQIQRVEPQEERFIARPGKVMEELAACEGIGGSEKNKLQSFLLEMGIQSITEMDYPLRRRYEEYLQLIQGIQKPKRYVQAYDRVKQYSIREQMQTLAGSSVSGSCVTGFYLSPTIPTKPLRWNLTRSGTGATWYGILHGHAHSP